MKETQRLKRVFHQSNRFFKGVGVDAIMVFGNKKTSSLGHFHQVYSKHLLQIR